MTNAAAQRRNRQAWRAARVRIGDRLYAPLPDEYHGRRSTATYYGCQCERCREANRVGSTTSPRGGSTSRSRSAPAQCPAKHHSKPAPSTQPEPVPKPVPEPAAEVRLPSDPIPAFSDSAADHVTSRAHFDLVLEAYHRPTIVTPVRDRSDLEARITDGCLIRVSRESGRVVFVGDATRDNGEPELLRAEHTPKPRKHGGAGTRLPTSYDEVLQRLRDLGCTLDFTRRHIAVTLPNGVKRNIPKSASDWRAVRNTVSTFRHAGLDLRRPQ